MNELKPVLLIEDDQVDVMIVRRAFDELEVANPLICVADGEEALDYLRNNLDEKPCVILLDLNMPTMNGFEFLEILRQDSQLKEIPVIVLTTSGAEQDINKCSELGIDRYMVKPIDYNQFLTAIQAIDQYWTYNQTVTNQ